MKPTIKIISIAFLMLGTYSLLAQSPDSLAKSNTPVQVFTSTRVINGHSTDLLLKNQLECRFTQRFADIANGVSLVTLGIDAITDMRLGIDYGISNKLMIGLGRSKGAGPFTKILDGFLKYNVLQQNKENTHPISISVLQTVAATYMQESVDSTLPSSFGGKIVRRFAYSTQLLIGKKFGERLSVLISPTFVHRNYVAYEDRNEIFSCGLSLRLKICKSFSILAESFLSTRYKQLILGNTYRNPLGIGFELKSGKTIFLANITNAKGIGETQFIPYTDSNIKIGQVRFGFSISHSLIFKKK